MRLSIVTTLFQSSDYIEEFYKRISSEAKKITNNYEIIFVDDGSPDDSLQKAVSIHEKDAKVIVLELSRNFGHHKAIMTGLANANGDFVFLIDSDLEEDPEFLGKFWSEIQNNNEIDVVYGVQVSRKGGWFEKFTGNLFYRLANKVTNIDIPKNVITCRLTTSQYNKALVSHKERELYLLGLWVISGFNQKAVSVKKHSLSNTSYSSRHKISLFFNFLTSFSSFPLKIIFYIGSLISLVSFIYILWIIFIKIFSDVVIEGWTSLIVSIWFLGGVMLLSLGIIGIYIAKIFSETKQRPYSIVRKKYEAGND